MIVRIFSEVLDSESITEHDSFFELGGHSLLAVKIANRVNKQIGCRLPMSVIFDRPTPAKLAELIEELESRSIRNQS